MLKCKNVDIVHTDERLCGVSGLQSSKVILQCTEVFTELWSVLIDAVIAAVGDNANINVILITKIKI